MNYIFEAKQTRGFLRRCTDYFALIIFAPLLLILSTGFTIFISAKLNTPGANHSYIFINIITYLLISFLFTFLYIFFPNSKIKVNSALIGGFIAALIYQLLQFAYLHVQFLLSSMGNVAATLGGISLFLIWVQLSWVIFLLGAKLTYSMQNIDAYEFIVEEFPLSEYTKEILSLLVTHHCIYEFCKNNPPPTVFEISTRLSIPLRITRELLDNLLYSEVLVEAKTQLQEENGYHPAHDVSQLTIKKVLDMINKRGETIPLPEKKEVESILGSLKVFEKLIEESKANILLKDIEVK
jgi:membrane protein